MDKNTNNKICYLYKDRLLSSVQISQKLNIPVSTINYHLSKSNIEKRSISEAITAINTTKFGKKSFVLRENLSQNEEELKIAGIMLYWGEGAKSGSTVKFTNSDPFMIQVFLNFLRKICGIHEERLKAILHLYPDQNKFSLLKYWSKTTKIPLERFYKTNIHKGKIGTYKTKSSYGTICINYSDKRLLQSILTWIEQFKFAEVAQR